MFFFVFFFYFLLSFLLKCSFPLSYFNVKKLFLVRYFFFKLSCSWFTQAVFSLADWCRRVLFKKSVSFELLFFSLLLFPCKRFPSGLILGCAFPLLCAHSASTVGFSTDTLAGWGLPVAPAEIFHEDAKFGSQSPGQGPCGLLPDFVRIQERRLLWESALQQQSLMIS